MARHSVILADNSLVFQNSAAVELYEYDAGAGDKRGAKVGDFSFAGNGQYFIDIVTTVKGVVVVDGVNLTIKEGEVFSGDDFNTGGSGSGFDNELLDQIFPSDDNQQAIDISSFGYSSAPKVVVVNKSSWPVYVASVTNTLVIVKPQGIGYGNECKFDLFFTSND